MALAEIRGVPDSPEDIASWSFSHLAHHRDINRVILSTYQIRIDEYSLDPFDPDNMNQWLDLHQQMHNEQNKALGIAGYNLSEVNWEDEQQRSQWIWANSDEHFRASKILGV